MTNPVIIDGIQSQANPAPRPNNASVGDLIVQIYSSLTPGSAYSGDVFSLPVNFTELGRERGPSTFAPELAACFKILASGDPATFSYSNALGTATLIGTFRVTGFDPANPISPIPASGNNSYDAGATNVTELFLSSVNNLKDGTLVVIGTRTKADALVAAGMTPKYTFDHSNNTSLGMTMLTLDLSAAGSSGDKLVQSVGAIASKMRALMFVINAVPETPPDPDPGTEFTATGIDPTTTGYNLPFTTDGNETVSAVAVIAGSSAPNATQIHAGQNGSGAAAERANSTAAVASVPGQLSLTGLDFPIYDVYLAVDADVVAFTGQMTLPPAGYQYLVADLGGSALPAESVMDADTAGNGATGSDILEISTSVSPQGVGITPTETGGFELASSLIGRCSFETRTYDYSAGAWHTESGLSAGQRKLWYINNNAPEEISAIPAQQWWTGIPIDEIRLDGLYVSDAEGDSLTFSIDPALPAGVTIDQVENQDGPYWRISGTPSDGEEGSDDYTITVTDAATDTVVMTDVTITVGTGVNVPDVDDEETTLSDAIDAILAAGLDVGGILYDPNSSVDEGNVVSVSPVGGTRVAPGSVVNMIVSGGAYFARSGILKNNTGSVYPEGTVVSYRYWIDGDVDSPSTRLPDFYETDVEVDADGQIQMSSVSGGTFWYDIYKTNADKSLSIIFSDQGEFT